MEHYELLSLQRLNAPYAQDIKDAISRVIDSGWYLRGQETERFENEMSAYLQVGHVVGVANGLDALRLIFKAYIEMGQLQHGDEVIVPANTFIASVLAITDCGLIPRLIDPDATTHNLDFTLAEQSITPHTRAILLVHLYGQACWDNDFIKRCRKRGLLIIEDNAQALGAKIPDGRYTGTLGDAAATSFYPGKNLGAMGDAGMVTTHNEQLAMMVRALGNYGGHKRYVYNHQGLNSRIDEMQAAVLRVKLPGLHDANERRSELAELYTSGINNPLITTPTLPQERQSHVWHQYVIRTPHREAFMQYMSDNGIETGIHYPIPPHKQGAYLSYCDTSLPITEQLAREVVSIPIAPYLSDDDAHYIITVINRFEYK